MPTALGRIRRRLDPGGSQSVAAQQAAGQSVADPIGPPFGGYTPDLAPALCNWGDGQRACSGLVQTRGTLSSPSGFARFHPATLPLGTDTPPAVGAAIQPVVALFLHRDITEAPPELRRYAVTSDVTLGHFYESITGAWTDIPYAGAGAGFTGLAGDAAPKALCDAAFSALADRIYLANKIDPVYEHVPGGADYTDFSPAVLNPFKARSVCAAFQRVLFFATDEGGSLFSNRVRYTTTGAAPSLSGTGAGFIDLEIRGEGLAIRPIGDRVIAYARHGLALLRETGSLTPSPIARSYIANERGILGTFAVCEIARGLHFGVFDDGWFFVNEDGLMTQAGMHFVGDRAYSKWRDDFYTRLNWMEADRVQTAYDPKRHQVQILWPSTNDTNLDQRWIYDINTDTVWPCPLESAQPNVLSFLAAESVIETWDSIGSTWETEGRLWDELTQAEGASKIAVGTRDGLVLAEDPSIYTIDGVVPSFEFLAARSDVGAPGIVKLFERLDVDYEIRVGVAPPDLTYIFETDAGEADAPNQVTITEPQLAGTLGARIIGYATSNLTGHTLSWGVSGTAPVRIHKVIPYIVPAGRTYRKNV